MVNVKDIVEIAAKGGIVSLDAIAVVFMFWHGKFFLNKKVSMDDYLAFRNEDRRERVMSEDLGRWRGRGIALYKWLPWIILVSVCAIVLAIVFCPHPEAVSKVGLTNSP